MQTSILNRFPCNFALRIDVWIDVERNNFYKYSIKFHTDLIYNFWSTKSNFAKFTGKLP